MNDDIELDQESPAATAPQATAALVPQATAAPTAAFDVSKVRDLVSHAADTFGIDKAYLAAVIMRESNLDPDVISGKRKSSAGAIGIAQFMPETAKRYGVDPLDPVSSIMGAAAYLSDNKRRFNGDMDKAVAGYNWGENRKVFDQDDWRDHLPAETRDYVEFVRSFAEGARPPAADPRSPLPAGVAPSAAGAGRGRINPTMPTEAPSNGGLVSPGQLGKDFMGGVENVKGLVRSAGAFGASLSYGAFARDLAAIDTIDATGKLPPQKPSLSGNTGTAYADSYALTRDPAERAKIREAAVAGLKRDESFIVDSIKAVEAYKAEALKLTGQMPDFTDIASTKDFTNWLLRQGANGTPTLVAAMIGAAAGPVGFAVTSGGMAVGDLTQGRIEHTSRVNDPKRFGSADRQADALAARGANMAGYLADKAPQTAALTVPYLAADSLLGPVARALRGPGASAATSVKQALLRGVKDAPGQSGGEALGEGTQEGVNIGGEMLAGERTTDVTRKDALRVINSAAAGAAVAPGGHAVNVGREAYAARGKTNFTPADSATARAGRTPLPTAESIARSKGFLNNEGIVNFTPADSATARAGLTPIVVDLGAAKAIGDAKRAEEALAESTVPTTPEEPDYDGVQSALAALPGAGSVSPGPNEQGGLAAAGPLPDVAGGLGNDPAGAAAGGQEAADVQGRVDLPGPAGADVDAGGDAPLESWMGRSGTGYTTKADAQQALPGRAQRSSQLEWRAEKGADGRYALNGYRRAEIDTRANEAATSPTNEIAQPTEAQKAAGNYKKGHVSIDGMNISIENPRGSERSGVDKGGNPWAVTMASHYGYVRGTEGADGDHIDVLVGEHTTSGKAFIVDQVHADGTFDEHKVVLGARSREEALVTYQANYAPGWTGAAGVTEMPTAQFKVWAKAGVRTKPLTNLKEVSDGERSAAERAARQGVPAAEGRSGASAAAAGAGGAVASPQGGAGAVPEGRSAVGATQGAVGAGVTVDGGPGAGARAAQRGAESSGVVGGPPTRDDRDAGRADDVRPERALQDRLKAEAVLRSIERERAKPRGDGPGEKIKLTAIPAGSSADTDMAAALARVFGKPIIFAHLDKPEGSTGFGAVVANGTIVITDDARNPLFALAMHEVLHTLDADIKAELIEALRPYMKVDAHKRTFPGYREAIREEEVAATLAQQHVETAAFWNEIAAKMGDGQFAKLARHILSTLERIVGKFRANNLTAYATEIDAVRDALTSAYVKQAQRVAGKATNVAEKGTADETEFSENEADRYRKMAADLMAKEAPPPQRASVKFFTGDQKAPLLRTNFDIARYFTNRNKRGMEAGNPDARRRLVESLRAEALYALSRPGSAVGWYDAKVKAALAIMAELHPEIATDPEAKFGFIAMLAITSNGTKVNANFEFAEILYRQWRDTGAWPTGDGVLDTKNSKPMKTGLAKVGALVAKHEWEAVRDFMKADRVVRDIEKMTGTKIASEGKDNEVYGAVFLGSKIGAFFNNLYGNFTPVTMDRWFMRTINRIRGNMLALPENTDSNLAKLVDQLAELDNTFGVPRSQLRAEIKAWLARPDEERADPELALQSLPGVREYAKARNDAFAKGVEIDGKKRSYYHRTRQNILAKTLHEGFTLDEQTPAGGGDRKYLRGVMLDLQKGLARDGIVVEMADLQAALWYHEKDLFELLKGRREADQDSLFEEERDEAEDYETAARRVRDLRESGAGGAGSVRPGQRPAGRPAGRAPARAEPAEADLFGDDPRTGTLINIGLDTPDGRGISAPEAITMLKSIGVQVLSHSVHKSDTEQTVVARLSRALTPAEANDVSLKLRQEAIGQLVDGKGELYGPKAAEWRPFDPARFLTTDGTRLAPVAAETNFSDNPLDGLPTPVRVDGKDVSFGPFAPAREAAAKYMADAGFAYTPPTTYIKADPARGAKVAAAFALMKHAPQDPLVKASYAALIDELKAQYRAILATGLKVEFNNGGDPYGNPRNAILDVVNNNHLYIFSTREGHGSDASVDVSDNPLLAETEFKFGGKLALANDVFRAVHDYFGHVKEGVGFRADGEENAWRSHVAMFSPLARRAMTTETRGQNSWVNFGPKAAHNKTASGADTIYADQKVGLLPEWVSAEVEFSDNPFPTIDTSMLSLAPREEYRPKRKDISDFSDVAEPMYRISSQVEEVPAKGPEAIAALREIASPEHANLFKLPKSDAKNLRQIVEDEGVGIQMKRFAADANLKGERIWLLTTPDDRSAFITIRDAAPHGKRSFYSVEKGGRPGGPLRLNTRRPGQNIDAVNRRTEEVYIDVSRMSAGSGMGAHIYNIAATLAHNTNRIFIGDPSDISDLAIERRPHQMISSALKFGTTRHLAPHPFQIDGTPKVNGLKWTYGDDDANVNSLAQVITNVKYNPKHELQFNAEDGSFTDARGVRVPGPSDAAAGVPARGAAADAGGGGARTSAAAPGLSPARAGGPVGEAARPVTAYRVAVLRSALAESSQEDGPGLLDELGRIVEEHGDSLDGIFYAANEAETPQGRLNEEMAARSFKKWFGDSKIVSAHGAPLVVYHGTSESFDEFDPDAQAFGNAAVDNGLQFFTRNPREASGYATRDGLLGANVRPAYLKIANPLVVDVKGSAAVYWDANGDRERDRMDSGGHDGIILRGDDAAGIMFITADPDQIRSAIGSNPATDDLFYAENPADVSAIGFYSGLSRAIAGGPGKAMPEQWVAYIRGLTTKGVKQDEITWSGINEWLDMQPGKVSKEEVQTFLDANGVRVTETTLRSPEFNHQRNEWQQAIDRAEADGDYGLADSIGRAWEGSDEETGSTAERPKFSQFTLPGGTNYREVLLTLPVKAYEYPAVLVTRVGDWVPGDPTDGKWRITVGGEDRGYIRAADEADAKYKAGDDARNRVENQGNYRSTHWDQPNVLAHIRMNDRTDADGKRVLFIEEIQSDWAQEGKKKGFVSSGKLPEGWIVKQTGPGGSWYVIDSSNTQVGIYKETREAAIVSATTRDGFTGGTPSAPFVGKTDAWVALAIKRVIKMAVDEGYDRVAFVTGEQSAERYDLSKQVDELVWFPDGKEGGDLQVFQGGLELSMQKGVAATALPDIIGKEAADRLLNRPTSTTLGRNGKNHTLSGIDLKVGGAGMKAFYDKIVPNVAKDVVKKLGGGVMAEVGINTEQDLSTTPDDLLVKINETSDGRFRVGVGSGENRVAKTVDTREQAQSWADEQVSNARGGKFTQQPGFDITPKMREQAEGGVPMFAANPQGPNNLATITPAKPKSVTRATEGWIVSRDELGRFRFGAGAKAYRVVSAIAKLVTDKIGFTPMSPELRRAVREMKNEVDRARNAAAKVAGEMIKMTPADREMVSDIIEGELKAGVVPTKKVLAIAQTISALMGKQTDELIAVGMLSQEAADKWRDKYLPRFYESKLRDNLKNSWDKAISRMMKPAGALTGIGGKSLRRRGMTEVIDAQDLKSYEAQGWVLDDPRFRPGIDRTVQVHRDFSRPEREKMGEIRDSMFRFVMGYMRSQKDLALGRLYEHLADTMASRNEIEGYVKVPDTQIDGTDVQTYGKLAGLYVPEEVLSHLSKFGESEHEAILNLYRKGLGMWKEGKTALNPVAHMNNVVSNLTMAHFAGVSYWDTHKYFGTALDFFKGAPMLLEAKDAGLFSGTVSQEELMNMLPKEMQVLAQMTQSTGAKAVEQAWNLVSLYLRRPLGAAYDGEDLFFRYLIYRDARMKGLHPNDAIDYAQRYIFTYDDLPKGARVVRDTALPFFSYTYKVVPVLAHTALNYPWRFAAPATAVLAIQTLTYAVAAGGDDGDDWEESIRKYVSSAEFREKTRAKEKAESANLPPWMKGYSAFGAKKTIRLGTDDLTNLPVFLDIARMFPGGDMLDVTSNTGGVPWLQNLTPSNPLLNTLAAMMWNKDPYFGKEIVDKNDTHAESAEKRGTWLWSQFAPAISINNYIFNRSMNAVAQATGKPVTWWPGDYTGVGKDGLPIQPGYAALQNIGIKARPMDLDMAAKIEAAQKKAMIRDIDREVKQLRRLSNRGAVTDAQAQSKIDLANEKKARLRAGQDVNGNEKDE